MNLTYQWLHKEVKENVYAFSCSKIIKSPSNRVRCVPLCMKESFATRKGNSVKFRKQKGTCL